MFKCELIVGTGANAVSLDLSEDLPLSLNYSVAEIQDLTKRNGDHTLTIKLPGTKKNNAFFEQTYDVNVKTSTWNPNIKVPAFFRQSADKPMTGDLRLLRIGVIDKNGKEDIYYETNVLGRIDTLLSAIGDGKLEDLDFSEYNHTFNYAKQNACESNTCDLAATPTICANGEGYRYPLVDYGYNGFNSNYYHVNHLRPAFFYWQYWNKIFEAAGKTYTGAFIDDANDLFRRELLLHNGEKLTMTAATQANRECYVGDDGTTVAQTKNLQSTGSTYNDWWTGDIFSSTSNSYLMKFNDETTLPFVDTGNIYDPLTGIITLAAAGNYNLSFNANFEIKFSAVPAGTVTINHSVNNKWALGFKILRSTDGGSTWTVYVNDTPNFQTSLISTSYQTFNKVVTGSGFFNSGDKFKLLIHPLYSPTGYGIVFKDGVGTPITVGTATISWKLKSTATLSCKLSSAEITEGVPVVVNDCIPRDIKQKDFILHCIKKYNLQVDIDKTDPNNFLIEPYNDFRAAGTTLDWTEKWAVNKPRIVEPMGAIDWKTFTLSYKQDQDYYNKVYQDSYQEAYGTHREVITNDFLQKELKNELIFSPTPVVDNPYNDLIIPKIFAFDGTTVKPMKHNIRSVLWRGSVSITNTWTYGSVSGNVTKTSYQGVAMCDDPINPTETIEFGVPNELFYSSPTLTYTTNNLFNRFYSQQISQLSHRDSKLVTMYLKLEPYDIANFDFRNKVWIKDSYYYVNKIMDYNPLKEELTKVEFLKIVSGTEYTPEASLSLADLLTNRGYVGLKTTPYGMPAEALGPLSSNRIGVGTNNNSESLGTVISGDSNRIGKDSETSNIIGSRSSSIGNSTTNCQMINCINCQIGDYCEDVKLENCVDYVVSESVSGFSASFLTGETIGTDSNGLTKSGNAVATSKIITESVNADFNVDPNVSEYYIDLSSNDVTATFNISAYGKRNVTFIIISGAAHDFIIDEVSGSPYVVGNAVPYTTGLTSYDSIIVSNDGSNFYIK